MNVKIKKLSDKAVIPKYSRKGDAGLDLTSTYIKETNMYLEYGTGLSFAIPEGYVGLLFPRSSLSNYDLTLANHVGVVDSNYRGEVTFRFKKTPRHSWSGNLVDPDLHERYQIGDRVGQILIIPIPEIEFEEVDELDETNRGTNGYGSSGK